MEYLQSHYHGRDHDREELDCHSSHHRCAHRDYNAFHTMHDAGKPQSFDSFESPKRSQSFEDHSVMFCPPPPARICKLSSPRFIKRDPDEGLALPTLPSMPSSMQKSVKWSLSPLPPSSPVGWLPSTGVSPTRHIQDNRHGAPSIRLGAKRSVPQAPSLGLL